MTLPINAHTAIDGSTFSKRDLFRLIKHEIKRINSKKNMR